ncbi:MAG: phosphonate ABC transporter ATP-binding protein [bacterium JZ-2024 1]
MSEEFPFFGARNLSVRARGGKEILSHIDVRGEKGEVLTVIGPSGAGKSTFLRCLNRMVHPTEGQIFFQHRDITRLAGEHLRKIRRKIGMVFQDYPVVGNFSVLVNVLAGRLGYLSPWSTSLHLFPREVVEKAIAVLEEVGLEGKKEEKAGHLSGGERQRVGVARALMQDPELLIADEPVSNLDPASAERIMEMLMRIQRKENLSIVMSVHDVGLARNFADRIIALKKGKVVWQGKPDEMSQEIIRQIYL